MTTPQLRKSTPSTRATSPPSDGAASPVPPGAPTKSSAPRVVRRAAESAPAADEWRQAIEDAINA